MRFINFLKFCSIYVDCSFSHIFLVLVFLSLNKIEILISIDRKKIVRKLTKKNGVVLA